MISYWNTKGQVRALDCHESGCWMRIVTPTEAEINQVRAQYDIPDYFFEDVNDNDERARYDSDDGWGLIIMRVPYMKDNPSRTPFITVPLGIIFKDDVLITLCHYNVQMVNDFIQYECTRGTGIIDTVDFVFKLFYASSEYYLKYLRQINQRIEESKRDLDGNIDNKQLISLSRLQDSLTYFITSLKGNDSLLSKLKFKLPVDELDKELIEDVNIELNQAMETAQIYATILDSTMNTYSSIINNNVNTIMKVLTSVSIILMLPTLLASFMGMNLINGMEDLWWGFPAAILLSAVISGIGWLIFKRKNLM